MKFHWLCSLLLLYATDAYKILVVSPLGSKSHSILGHGIVNILLNAGHEVTCIQGFKMKKTHPNLTEILPNTNKNFLGDGLHHNIVNIMSNKLQLNDASFLLYLMYKNASRVIQDEAVQDLFKDQSQSFDAIIAEWMFSSMYSVLPAIYGCPLIWFSTMEPHWQALRMIDEPLSPAYNPDVLSNLIPPFSFYDRVNQLRIQMKTMLVIRRIEALEKEVYHRAIAPHVKAKGMVVPAYEELLFNASLMFGNSHVSTGRATRLPQNYIHIGGYHVEPKVTPLPDEMQKLMDESKDGVIYFSLGTNLKSKDIPQEIKEALLEVFGELKQTVIWKFEEILGNAPKNVHIVKWAPQQSILAHPNTVLFITHGGLLSKTEAIHFGVPLIGIPVYADQFINVEKSVQKGIARKVDLSYSMAEDLRREIKEILSNPAYAQKAKEWSLIYHDRLVLPQKALVYWTDHVIRTRGAMHLRSPALMMPWYHKIYLDLVLLILVALTAVVITINMLWKRYVSGQSVKQKEH